MKLLKHLPNAITCMNLLCGCLALVLIFRSQLYLASCLVIVAMVCDFFDGMVARLLKANSPIGKELDSLADVVSFGVVPAAIIYQLMNAAMRQSPLADYPAALQLLVHLAPFSIAIFSALRLANFNVDERQHSSFIGLPTPASAMLVIALPFMLKQNAELYQDIILQPLILLTLTAALSYLLVSPIPLLSLKFANFGFKGNELRYLLIASSSLLIIVLHAAGIPLIITIYILLSVLENTFLKKSS